MQCSPSHASSGEASHPSVVSAGYTSQTALPSPRSKRHYDTAHHAEHRCVLHGRSTMYTQWSSTDTCQHGKSTISASVRLALLPTTAHQPITIHGITDLHHVVIEPSTTHRAPMAPRFTASRFLFQQAFLEIFVLCPPSQNIRPMSFSDLAHPHLQL